MINNIQQTINCVWLYVKEKISHLTDQGLRIANLAKAAFLSFASNFKIFNKYIAATKQNVPNLDPLFHGYLKGTFSSTMVSYEVEGDFDLIQKKGRGRFISGNGTINIPEIPRHFGDNNVCVRKHMQGQFISSYLKRGSFVYISPQTNSKYEGKIKLVNNKSVFESVQRILVDGSREDIPDPATLTRVYNTEIPSLRSFNVDFVNLTDMYTSVRTKFVGLMAGTLTYSVDGHPLTLKLDLQGESSLDESGRLWGRGKIDANDDGDEIVLDGDMKANYLIKGSLEFTWINENWTHAYRVVVDQNLITGVVDREHPETPLINHSFNYISNQLPSGSFVGALATRVRKIFESMQAVNPFI